MLPAVVAFSACAPERGGGDGRFYASLGEAGGSDASDATRHAAPGGRVFRSNDELPGPHPREGVAGADLHLTLEEAIRHALENNRSLLNRQLDRELEGLSLDVAGDRWRPRFVIEPSLAWDSPGGEVALPAGMTLRLRTGGTLDLGWRGVLSDGLRDGTAIQAIGISQPLLKGAGAEMEAAPVRRALIENRIQFLALRRALADVVVEVVDSYRAVIAASRQVEIAEESLSRARDQLDATRSLIRAGRVAEREAGRSEAVVANREIGLVRARSRLEAASARLVDTLDPGEMVMVHPRGELAVADGQGLAAPELEDVLLGRTDFRQAVLMVEAARIDLAVARNNLLPDLSLRLELSRDAEGRSDTAVRLGVAIPLNDREPRVEYVRARNGLLKAERNVTELRESIRAALRQALNEVEAGLLLAGMAGDARALAERNLAVEEAKFGQGLSSTFEVGAAEGELVRAEQAEADAILALLAAQTRLDRISGRTLERWGIRLKEDAR